MSIRMQHVLEITFCHCAHSAGHFVKVVGKSIRLLINTQSIEVMIRYTQQLIGQLAINEPLVELVRQLNVKYYIELLIIVIGRCRLGRG